MDLTRTDWSSTPFSLSSEPMSSLAVARRSRTARLVVGGALATGAVTQALFWRVGIGLNFFLWTLLAVAASLASVRPRRVTRFAWGLIVAACLLGFSVLRFAGDWTLAIAVPTDLALLALLPLVLRDPVQMRDAARLPLLAARTLRRAPRAAREATRLPTVALGGHGAVWLQVVRGTLVGLPVTGIFVLLLSADIDFRMLLGRMEAKLGDALSFGAWTVATAAGSLLTHVLLQLPEPDASSPGAASQMAYRCATTDAAVSPSAPGARVVESTWVMVVGQVAVVFALFVAVNVKSLFGGDALVRAPGSLTYAKYLHAGFGQLLLAAALSGCLVVVGHGLLRARMPDAAASPVPGGRLLVSLECTLLALTAITVASCAQRLAIYQEAYGATRLRLGVAFVIVTVLCALALTAKKAVHRAWTGYGGALVSSIVGVAVVASSLNADAYVAWTNLDRAARGRALDVATLTSLSVDARGALSHPRVLADADLQATLQRAYCPDRSSVDWRAFRGIGRCGE